MTKTLILIPPSEGKQKGGTNPPLKKVTKNVAPILERLQNYSGDFEKLIGVKGKNLEQAIAANTQILTNPTLPSIERYCGVVYDGISYESLNKRSREFFNTHVRIISALFGLVAPLDLLPEYKLKIDKLDATKHWRTIHEESLKDTFIIDLLPQAHHKAIAYSNGVRIDFVIEKDGERKPAGHNGKLIKGKFVRWLCENKITSTEKLPQFKINNGTWQVNNNSMSYIIS